ncbi:GNAT family N-acetyltransferase [Candidimonas sp. SYP-B2681]|nr:GNAT family N-acetyltransferase [Candidimonas sp. SYP-B2681]
MKVRLGNWESCKQDATQIRHQVFVQEQNVPPEEELDPQDEFCIHALAYEPSGVAVGTGRLLPNAHIGRMAVLAPYRGKGIGTKLLTALVDEARRQRHLEVVLSAQVHAQRFYAAHGFVAEGNIYMDAGIEHVTMRHALTA